MESELQSSHSSIGRRFETFRWQLVPCTLLTDSFKDSCWKWKVRGNLLWLCSTYIFLNSFFGKALSGNKSYSHFYWFGQKGTLCVCVCVCVGRWGELPLTAFLGHLPGFMWHIFWLSYLLKNCILTFTRNNLSHRLPPSLKRSILSWIRILPSKLKNKNKNKNTQWLGSIASRGA